MKGLQAWNFIRALKLFQDIIYNYSIEILTGYQLLLHIFENKSLQGKKAHWFLIVQEYNPKFTYQYGKANTAADVLLRQPAAAFVYYHGLDFHEALQQYVSSSIYSDVIKHQWRVLLSSS